MRLHHAQIGIDFLIYGQALTQKAASALPKRDLRPSLRRCSHWIKLQVANSKQVACAIISSGYKREDGHWPMGQLTSSELKCPSFDKKHEVYHAVGPIVPTNRDATR